MAYVSPGDLDCPSPRHFNRRLQPTLLLQPLALAAFQHRLKDEIFRQDFRGNPAVAAVEVHRRSGVKPLAVDLFDLLGETTTHPELLAAFSF